MSEIVAKRSNTSRINTVHLVYKFKPDSSAYERKIKELETQKAVMKDKIANCGKPLKSFSETYRTAFDFLANPSKLWLSPRLEDRRAVLKLVFAERLAYARNEGYRTAKISTPFKMLGDIDMSKKGMVPYAGVKS
ncbi:hypothetical protein C8J38_10837 [Rhizobium sp. PP-WC-2G-219]|nr:hypothetical protein C8J38_10837 [Rhizobium sp. PP-WC-2G-219]